MPSEATGRVEALKRNSMQCEIPADPCAIVIFGASGDLAKRKLVPALYDLAARSCLAQRYSIVGFARTALSDDEFRSSAGEALRTISELGPLDERVWQSFTPSLRYHAGNYDDPESFRKLAHQLDDLDREHKLEGNRLFYLATPPEVYTHVIEQLGRAGLAKPRKDSSWVRIIIEKPFGRDRA